MIRAQLFEIGEHFTSNALAKHGDVSLRITKSDIATLDSTGNSHTATKINRSNAVNGKLQDDDNIISHSFRVDFFCIVNVFAVTTA